MKGRQNQATRVNGTWGSLSSPPKSLTPLHTLVAQWNEGGVDRMWREKKRMHGEGNIDTGLYLCLHEGEREGRRPSAHKRTGTTLITCGETDEPPPICHVLAELPQVVFCYLCFIFPILDSKFCNSNPLFI